MRAAYRPRGCPPSRTSGWRAPALGAGTGFAQRGLGGRCCVDRWWRADRTLVLMVARRDGAATRCCAACAAVTLLASVMARVPLRLAVPGMHQGELPVRVLAFRRRDIAGGDARGRLLRQHVERRERRRRRGVCWPGAARGEPRPDTDGGGHEDDGEAEGEADPAAAAAGPAWDRD